MSICDSAAGTLGFFFKPKRFTEKQTLSFYSYNLKGIEDVIKSFHSLYMEKLSNLQSSKDMNNETIIQYYVRYIDTLIEYLQSAQLNSKKDGIPYHEMSYILRAVQGFILDYNISCSIIKLRTEIYGARCVKDNQTFNMACFYDLIKAGNLSDARKYFRKHPSYLNFPQSHLIESLLSPENRIFGLVYKNEDEFSMNFLKTKTSSENLLRACQDFEDYKNICQILTGNLDFFLRLRPNWLEVIIFFSLFKEGIIKNFSEIVGVINTHSKPVSPIENILMAVVIDNPHLLVQQASEVYPSVFVAHLVEILASCEKIDINPQDIFDDLNYPEFYFLNFVKEIMTNLLVPVDVVCDYIYYNLGAMQNCGDLLSYAMNIRIKQLDIESTVHYFSQKSLEDLAMGVYKQAALAEFELGRLSKSIEYSIKSRDKEFKLDIENRILKFVVSLDDNTLRLIIKSSSKVYLSDSVILYFLSSYLQFIDQISEHKIEEAARSFIKFFQDQAAPIQFYERIFLSSLPLFQSGLVLSHKNFFTVLKAFEKLCQTEASKETIEILSYTLGQASSYSLS